MLWYKAWLETRIRLWIALGYTGVFLILLSLRTIAPSALPPPRTNPATGLAMGMMSFATVICMWLAGAGIVTQPAFQAIKGLHGSTQFTLSLPVSRLHLLAVRAALGWMEMVGAIGIFCWGTWLVAPSLMPGAKAVEVFKYAETLIACASALYFLSVLLATFLDDQWRMGGTLAASIAMWLLLPNVTPLPAYANIFRAIGEGSSLLTHTVPWTPIAFSLALSAILFLAALKIVQIREY